MLIIVKYLLAKISDAFWCALNAQVFDQFSCCRDFLSGKFAVKANLELATWLELAVESCQALGGVLHVMQHAAALNHVIDVLKLIGIQDVQFLELNAAHVVFLRFSCCVGQAFGADINGRDLRIFIAAGVDDLIPRSASRDQNFRAGVGR